MSSPADRYSAARRRQEATKTPLGAFSRDYDFELDPFQLEACEALEAGAGVLVAAPTGSGKTVVGEFAIYLALEQGTRCFYTTPIKALSNQKFLKFQAHYGADKVGLLTGDNSINGEAEVVVMTTEILRNMLYAQSSSVADLGHVVMDEVHYLADRSRGAVWEEVLINLPERVTVTALSATVSNAEEFGRWLTTVRGETAVVVEEHRPVPLTQHVLVRDRLEDLFVGPPRGGQPRVNPDLTRLTSEPRGRQSRRGRERQRKGRRSFRVSRPAMVNRLESDGLLPAIDFVFSRAGCDAAVDQCLLDGITLTTESERAEVTRRARESVAALSESDLDALGYRHWLAALERGVAAHHAGMVPVFKEIVEDLFTRGLVKIVFATETLALGINMPARSVVLERLVKWNGEEHVELSAGEYTQLTGRAGRRGIDVEGHAVVAWTPDLDVEWLAGLASTRTYPLRSSFRPSYNMAVNLVTSVGRSRAVALLETSFAQFQADESVVDLASEIRRNNEATEGYEQAMACQLGDFAEYSAIRSELTQLEKSQAQDRRRRQSAADFDAFRSLRRGDVIQLAMGRRQVPAVVAEAANEDHENILVVDIHERARRIHPNDVQAGLQAYDRIDVPDDFSAKSANSRKPLVKVLKGIARGLPKHPTKDQGQDEEAVGETAELRRRLKDHPCHGCEDRESHARWAERYHRNNKRNAKLQRRIDKRTNTIATGFDHICDVLTELGYLEGTGKGSKVTDDGRMLAKIYGDADLITAEAVRSGRWDSLKAADLAAVCAALVYESRRDDGGGPRLPRGPASEAIRQLEQVAEHVHELEERHSLKTLPEIDAGLFYAIHRWASGTSLDAVLWEAELTAGDFVRWNRQVIDLLGQIADATSSETLAPKARKAADLINRGVVAYTGVHE